MGMIEYSMVMPSMSEYVETLGGSNLFYGACVGLFSFARLCAMPLVGLWSDMRPMKEVCFRRFSPSVAPWSASVEPHNL